MTPTDNRGRLENFDANLTALVKNGKITEIVVENGGSMYATRDIQVSGSGSS